MNLIGIRKTNLRTEIVAETTTKIVEEQHDSQQVAENLSSCEWYSGIIHFLQNLEFPPQLTLNRAWALKLKSLKFCVIDKLFYWKDLSGALLRCLDKEE